jgi:hypothetical protein
MYPYADSELDPSAGVIRELTRPVGALEVVGLSVIGAEDGTTERDGLAVTVGEAVGSAVPSGTT